MMRDKVLEFQVLDKEVRCSYRVRSFQGFQEVFFVGVVIGINFLRKEKVGERSLSRVKWNFCESKVGFVGGCVCFK